MGMTGFNWLDWLMLAVLAFYAVEGLSIGFFAQSLDLVSFVLAFLIGLKFYAFIGLLVSKAISLPQGFSNAIGFFIGAFLAEIILTLFLRRFTINVASGFKNINRILGVFPGLLSGLILISFLLTLVVALPVSSYLKNSISSSRIGSVLVTKTQGLEKELNAIFGPSVSATLNFLTIEPKSNEIVSLRFTTKNISIDAKAEDEMFFMVNKERVSQGLSALSVDAKLREVGRNHCKDMLERGYFSHYTPEGLSPFDRMERAEITFIYAGENLALSPNTILAMQGLMQSPGHRENILSSNFGKIGVGVIDGGIFGEMFCQEFTS